MSNILDLSIVIPLHQEGETLPVILQEVTKYLNAGEESYEIILVDDGSPDETWQIITTESLQYPTLSAIQLSRNFGKEAAICAGLERSLGRAVIVMDGDMQHPPSMIPEMIRLWKETGAAIVEGIKVNRGNESVASKLRAKMFYTILSRFSGFNFEGASDFKLIDRKALQAWLQMKERNIFFRGMSAWLGFKRVQVPFSVVDRDHGQSHWSFFRLFRLAVTGITSFTTFPLHLITLAGVGFAIFSVILGIQTLYNKFVGLAVSGFTTVIILLLMIGSIMMVGMGIVGEYIARIYEEVKGRPRYLISQTIEKK